MIMARVLLSTAVCLGFSACGGDGGATKVPPTASSASAVQASSALASSSLSVSVSSVMSSVASSAQSSTDAKKFSIRSTAIAEGGRIPERYTCDGVDINPPLSWEGAPEATRSFAVIVDDPDAVSIVGYTWVHWNIFNIPPSTTALMEGASSNPTVLPAGAIEGVSNFGSAKYRGPCPPSGNHLYYYSVYALSTPSIQLNGPTTRSDFETRFANDIISKTYFTAYFSH